VLKRYKLFVAILYKCYIIELKERRKENVMSNNEIIEKVKQFNVLKEELEKEIGWCFDEIKLVEEYPEDVWISNDGIHFSNNDGCEENPPTTILIKL
jgi:hypothetical protein